ncbi:MAG: MmcQ/YjbR family DNA-binding protein [Bacteroidia bacterium]|nr:MmcQ/YjbR family DNA-binding protein [Bacteroidia bacterium]
MNIETLRAYCIQKPLVTEEFPFDEVTLVFKVLNKAFLLTGLDAPGLQFNVKCDPEKAIELREQFDCVQPGFHMNKKHWNTIHDDGTVTDKQLKEWIDHSYDMVVAGMPKKDQERVMKNKEGKRKKNSNKY